MIGKIKLYCFNKNDENNSIEVKIAHNLNEFILNIKSDYIIDNLLFYSEVYSSVGMNVIIQ